MRNFFKKQTTCVLLTALLNLVAHAATENILGDVKVVKITQQVSLADCQEKFELKEYSSFCKIPVWTLRDTDLLVSMNESIVVKIQEPSGKILRASLATHSAGFYWFIFERKASDGMPLAPPSYSQALPVMQNLLSQLENGEVYWKLYRLQ